MDDSAPNDIASRPVFIVGAPRSGTSWVQRLLLSDSAICGGQESHFFNVFGVVLRSFDYHKKIGRNVGLPSYWDKSQLQNEILTLWLKTVAPIIDRYPHARYLIEKTPDHAMVLDEILQMLPQARVIHVVRDSRSVAASLLAASQDWGSQWAPKSARDAALLWYRYSRQVLKARGKMRPDQYMMVRYEDLLRDGPGECKRLFDFIGIDKSPQSLAELIENQKFSRQKESAVPIPVVRGSSAEPKGFFRNGTADSWRKDLSLWQKIVVWRYTRKLMQQLGYNWNGRDFRQP